MTYTEEIKLLLQQSITVPKSKSTLFFKTGVGDYAENDQFIGVTVPKLRSLSKRFLHIPLTDIQELLQSPINEERHLALFILVELYKKNKPEDKEIVYQFYLNNLKHVNNWNLVDSSAHLIIGAHLQNENKNLLIKLAQSQNIWERRIAIVSTWYFIRNNNFEWTFNIASALLDDTHDLIHKAVGWMLREAGKRNTTALQDFLSLYAPKMPRTMLRYAIEKFSIEQRKNYLLKK